MRKAVDVAAIDLKAGSVVECPWRERGNPIVAGKRLLTEGRVRLMLRWASGMTTHPTVAPRAVYRVIEAGKDTA